MCVSTYDCLPRSQGSRSKHLSRVAAEYTHLLYHADKARKEKCAFADEIQPVRNRPIIPLNTVCSLFPQRIERIKLTLSRDLDHLLSTTLSSLASATSESSSADKARWTSELNECFRIYDSLGSWRDAEEVIRTTVVRPFVKKVSSHFFRLSGLRWSHPTV